MRLEREAYEDRRAAEMIHMSMFRSKINHL